MLHDAACIPPISINNLAKSTTIIQPALGSIELGAQDRDLLTAPYWTEDVPRRVESVLSVWIMVLDSFNVRIFPYQIP